MAPNIDTSKFYQYFEDAPLENTKEEKFSAKKFFKNVIESGAMYDDTINVSEVDIPPYFDKAKFKRGQKFYEKHAFAIYFSTVLGLIGSFGHPSAEILGMNTKRGKRNAVERYWATSKHMFSWYFYDLEMDSTSFRSLRHVRRVHHLVNKATAKYGLEPISQLYLTGAQFAFFAFPIFRSDKLGVFGATKEEEESFVHFWRVIGYFMGLDDKYNVCRDSLTETKEICEEMVNMVWLEWAVKPAEGFEERVKVMVDALKKFDPLLNQNALVCIYKDTITNSKSGQSQFYNELTLWEKVSYWHITFVLSLQRFSVVKRILNWGIKILQKKVHG